MILDTDFLIDVLRRRKSTIEKQSYAVAFSTLCFDKEDNIFLADLLSKEIGGTVKVRKTKDHRTSKTYYRLTITHSQNIKKFFRYLDLALKANLSLAKENFPWKFSKQLKINLFLRRMINTIQIGTN